ncbi:MAG: hypothetical protein RL108_172 [Bacteroidota bacterium]|jgi:hypothetical protein
MTIKTKTTISLILTILVSALFIFSAVGKIAGTKEVIEGAKAMGLTPATMRNIGIIELIITLLFASNRTGVIGGVLLLAYMGGAIATHLEHGQSVVAPIAIAVFVGVVALFRFPELTLRVLKK